MYMHTAYAHVPHERTSLEMHPRAAERLVASGRGSVPTTAARRAAAVGGEGGDH
jgi:hypothetical protein